MHTNVFVDNLNRKITSVNNVFGNFLVEKGLYEEIVITKDNVFELADLIGGHVKIDIYCPKCKENRVFACEPIYRYHFPDCEIRGRSIEEEIIEWQQLQNVRGPHFADDPEPEWTWQNGIISYETRVMIFRFYCSMDYSHRTDYIVLIEGNKMKKIGQYPTVADLTFPELNKYKKVMPSEQDEVELKKARGLYANGIGVGSFVYLRRIFERILNASINKAIEDKKINEEDLKGKRVDERINLVSDYLPNVLVKNIASYGIISKGIHELSEEECRTYFPVLETFIMMTLKQWESIRQEQEAEKKLSAEINKISSAIK